jgi:PAS domain S-box-containing protein
VDDGADELRRSQERYALAMQASEEGFWDWIVATDEFYASPRMLELYGFPPDTVFTGRDDFLARFPFHPEDRPKWQEAVAAHFAGKTSRFDKELRIVRGGETRWLHVTGLATRDASGQVVRWTGATKDVTARKQTEEALRLSEKRYALVMAASDEGYWDWIVATDEFYASPRLLEIYGFPPGTAFAGREDLLARFPIHPEDRRGWQEGIAAHFAGKTERFEKDLRILRGGEIRWLHLTGLATRNASGEVVRWTGATKDMTARRSAEEALRISEERYALAMQATGAGHWDWKVATDEYYTSPRHLEIAGFPPGTKFSGRAEVVARVQFHPDDRPKYDAAVAAHFAGETPRLDIVMRLVRPDELRWVHLIGMCLRDAAGVPVRWAGSVTDITEYKRAEEELKRLERQLRQAQKLEALGTLAGGIAHDFNNILGAMLGYGEMALRDTPKGSRLRRDLDSIMIAGERGRALIDRILAFSRSGVGERVAVHVEAVIREVLDLLSAKLPDHVRVEADLRAARATTLGDPTQVHQVFMNLATNAIQAMASGGVLRVSLETLRLDAPRPATTGEVPPGEHLVLKVIDSGAGIAPEILERIFDPFFTTKEVGVGTGLGLSLVYGIVAELGGAIEVASTVGNGSAFTVYLPRADDAAEERSTEQPQVPRGDGQRLLVVDDDKPLLTLATRTLEELGYAPVGFASSTAALEAFRADPGRFDAIVTDERMPGLSGSALIREVRQIRRAIPILLVGGYLGGQVTALALEAGADEVLKKPLLARDLAVSLARVLASSS